jgi:hypothetical protein
VTGEVRKQQKLRRIKCHECGIKRDVAVHAFSRVAGIFKGLKKTSPSAELDFLLALIEIEEAKLKNL